jgi:L-lactate dehydrogenase complex protein LldG
MAEGAGSSVERLASAREIAKWVHAQTGFGGEIFDLYSDSGHDTLQRIIEHTFIDEDMVVLGCTLGVAENGAVWVDNEILKSRKIPFVAGHLVFVLRSDRIVADMHEAYTRIDLNTPGFGVFIAGPSKTADIEQSLVIGAHGPVRNTVVLY